MKEKIDFFYIFWLWKYFFKDALYRERKGGHISKLNTCLSKSSVVQDFIQCSSVEYGKNLLAIKEFEY